MLVKKVEAKIVNNSENNLEVNELQLLSNEFCDFKKSVRKYLTL